MLFDFVFCFLVARKFPEVLGLESLFLFGFNMLELPDVECGLVHRAETLHTFIFGLINVFVSVLQKTFAGPLQLIVDPRFPVHS